VFRIQGFAPSVVARARILERLLAEHGRLRPLADGEAAIAWRQLRTFETLPMALPLWRINVAPSRSVAVVAELGGDGHWLGDWGGGLLWLASDADPDRIRRIVAQSDGHATLVRSAAYRADIPCLHPQPRGLAALEQRVRRAFDPNGVFEAGRF
jgi:glycolate oxidase FAD binding subunit